MVLTVGPVVPPWGTDREEVSGSNTGTFPSGSETRIRLSIKLAKCSVKLKQQNNRTDEVLPIK